MSQPTLEEISEYRKAIKHVHKAQGDAFNMLCSRIDELDKKYPNICLLAAANTYAA